MMLIPYQLIISDTDLTHHDTRVSVNIYFKTRKLKKEFVVYLIITGSNERVRINTNVRFEDASHWDEEKELLKNKKTYYKDLNLVLENYKAKINSIRVAYRLANRRITPLIIEKELNSGMPRISFISFFKIALEEERKLLSKGTYNRHESVLRKLTNFNPNLHFSDISEGFFDDYRKWCLSQKNKKTTIAANIASIKKFIKIAQKKGIYISINLEYIKTGSTKGHRVSLSKSEMQKILKYYFSEFINDYRKNVLGYFLFSCFTGIRISDIQKIQRKNLSDDHVSFISEKTKTQQSVTISNTCRKVIEHNESLFIKHFTDQYLNRELKKVMFDLGITKKITFHSSRHTFSTNYLRAGGKIEKLKLLLGHTKIETTMIYNSIVASEANEDVFRLDDYYN